VKLKRPSAYSLGAAGRSTPIAVPPVAAPVAAHGSRIAAPPIAPPIAALRSTPIAVPPVAAPIAALSSPDAVGGGGN
jgi:hypothetical protein